MSALPPPPPPPPHAGPPVPPYGAPPPGYTPYAQRAAPPYAGFGARLGGYLLDSILYGLLMAAIGAPAIVMGVLSVKDCDAVRIDSNGNQYRTCGPGQLKGGLLAGAIVVGVVAVLVVAILYVRALGRTGQTWGRKIAGVRVISASTGQPLGVGRALGRCLIEGLVSGNCVLGYLWMLWDDQKQTWHDKIIGSIVVKA